MKFNLIFSFIFINLQLFPFYAQEKLDSLSCLSELDSLEAHFGKNKEVLASYRVCIYKTLSYYPELKNTRIKFKNAHLKTSLTTRPTLMSLFFRRKKNRTYIVRIDDDTSKIRIKDASFNAKIGVFGHEFAHIVDYSHRNIFGVIARGFSYLSKKKKEKFEKYIDLLTINHHLKYQLYDWAVFVLNSPKGSVEYKDFKRQIYLEPEEILGE